jgi:hypothetical protein
MFNAVGSEFTLKSLYFSFILSCWLVCKWALTFLWLTCLFSFILTAYLLSICLVSIMLFCLQLDGDYFTKQRYLAKIRLKKKKIYIWFHFSDSDEEGGIQRVRYKKIKRWPWSVLCFVLSNDICKTVKWGICVCVCACSCVYIRVCVLACMHVWLVLGKHNSLIW